MTTDAVRYDVYRGAIHIARGALALVGRLWVGTDRGCDLVVADPDVHPRHMSIVPTRGGIRLVAEAGCRFEVGGIAFSNTPSTRCADIVLGGCRIVLAVDEPASLAAVPDEADDTAVISPGAFEGVSAWDDEEETLADLDIGAVRFEPASRVPRDGSASGPSQDEADPLAGPTLEVPTWLVEAVNAQLEDGPGHTSRGREPSDAAVSSACAAAHGARGGDAAVPPAAAHRGDGGPPTARRDRDPGPWQRIPPRQTIQIEEPDPASAHRPAGALTVDARAGRERRDPQRPPAPPPGAARPASARPGAPAMALSGEAAAVIGRGASPPSDVLPSLPWSVTSAGRRSPGRVPPTAAPPVDAAAARPPQPAASVPVEPPRVGPLGLLWSLLGGQTITGLPDRLPYALLLSSMLQVGLLLIAGSMRVELPEVERLALARDRYMRYVGRYVTQAAPGEGAAGEEVAEPLDEEPTDPEPEEPPEEAAPPPPSDEAEVEAPPSVATPPETHDRRRPKAPAGGARSGPRAPHLPRTPVDPLGGVVGRVATSGLLGDPMDTGSPGVIGRPTVERGASGAFDDQSVKPSSSLDTPTATRKKLKKAVDERPPPPTKKLTILNVPSRIGGGSADERQAIKSTIGQVHARFRHCVDSAALTDPDLSGRLETSFEIRPDGRADRIEARLEPKDHRGLADCVIRVISDLQFAPPGGQRVISVTYPFQIRSTP